MTVHTAFTGFEAIEPGAMIFLESDAALAAGDLIDVTVGESSQTRLTVIAMYPGGILASEAGRADHWMFDLTEHGLSDFPVRIVPLALQSDL